MKIFNVSVRVNIMQIAEIPDNPPETPKKRFNDDPVDKQAAMLDKYLGKMMKAFPAVGVFPGGEQDGAAMTQNIRVTAHSFEDLAAILKQFSDVAKGLSSAVPDSIVRSAEEDFTPQ